MAPATHTFLFADLVGFTALTEERGDEAAADLACRFAHEAARMADEHGVDVVKSLGDAVMIRADDADEAIRLGLRLSSDLRALDGFPPVHAGAHTGVAVERGGDWFGAAVNLAARVSGAARGGELLLTEATLAAAGRLAHIEFEELGPQLFKNIANPTSVYAARRRQRGAQRTQRGALRLVPPALRPAAATAALSRAGS
ncbi:MAG TPA: adenylate/guanylate cyclase domain-containing protein [Thermoleophilaceae bacterium]|jgi:adenylate cyclase